MKKLLVGMLFLGLANLAYPQNSDCECGEIKLSNVEVSPTNLSYLDKVQEGTSSELVLDLEKKASRYNVKKSPNFAGPHAITEIRFGKPRGSVQAFYNGKGKILYANERFSNILLPEPIRNKVYRIYPGWIMNKNVYSVNYNHRKGAKKMYKIQMEKDGSKRNLKLDSEGNPI